MKTIYKYPLSIIAENLIQKPRNAEILSIQMQNSIPCIWALVETNNETELKIIEIIPTGSKIEPLTHHQGRQFIGTFQMQGGSLVFHAFEII